jgi:hypothetical protein
MSSEVSFPTVELMSARVHLRLVAPHRGSVRRFRAEPRSNVRPLRADRAVVCPVLRFRVASVLRGPGARFDAA